MKRERRDDAGRDATGKLVGHNGEGVRNGTSSWSTAGKSCAALRDISPTRTTCLEGELFNEGRVLIKVAVAKPPRPDHEIRDAGPAQVAAAFWPSSEIYFLVVR